ncbi:MAG: hypothetical protein KC506_02235 [Nanoarchaeota archaeon]|nr:hypothetical protein [Nanoarchaeota archaeon]
MKAKNTKSVADVVAVKASKTNSINYSNSVDIFENRLSRHALGSRSERGSHFFFSELKNQKSYFSGRLCRHALGSKSVEKSHFFFYHIFLFGAKARKHTLGSLQAGLASSYIFSGMASLHTLGSLFGCHSFFFFSEGVKNE